MRNLTIPLLAILCTSCGLQPVDVQKAPLETDQAVVFDIDGTLTPKQSAIFTTRDGAADAVRFYADKGYKIIYLSARTRLFQAQIPGWLEENHFPKGSIHVPQTATDSSDHAAFKKNILNNYITNGWQFVAAYGDSSTDFKAYTAVGIKKENIFALQHTGETSCESGIWAECLSSWGEHIDGLAIVAQP